MRKIDKDILRLAFPAILNNITVPLLGLSDTAIAGHLGDTACIGAMAVGTMMLTVIIWLCSFLRAGTTGLTANAYGARDVTSQRAVLKKAMVIAGAISLLTLSCQVPLRKALIWLIAPDPDITGLATTYFNICVWTIPAQLGVMVASGWFIGMQNTAIPAAIAIGINVVNIIVSVTLVFGFDLGFAGIATGTLAANWLGLAVILTILRLRLPRPASQSEHSTRLNTNSWGSFFSVNSNLFIRSMCIMGVSLTVTAVGARLGEVTLAVNALMMQFFLFFSYFMDGFAFAGEALVGKEQGADSNGVGRVVRALLQWGAAMAVVFFLIYFFGAHTIASLLTDDVTVLCAADAMLPWVMALPPITVAAFIYDGIFIGLTRTLPLLTTTIAATAIFLVITFLIPGFPSNHRLWLAFEAYLLARGVQLAIYYHRLNKKLSKKRV